MTMKKFDRRMRIARDPKQERIYMEGFVSGVRTAAALAAEYPTTHPFRIDDCIACKLNVTRRKKPRRRAVR